ncbi:MAG: MCE family protein [Epsilonproteobacteria bacterium]|nr:MAG: MCE family protein [Campylobacterota bacterium]
MYSKVNYTIVGIFVLLFGVGVLWFGFWLAKYGIQETFDTYRLEMTESISGLSKDSNVRLHGVDIGRVSHIRINPNNIEKVEILLKIKRGIPIKEDMLAHTQMLGVTGLLSIEIDGGSNAAKTLIPAEDYIPLIASKPSLLSKLTDNIEGLGEKLEKLLSQSQKLLSDKHIQTLGNILDNVEKVTARGEEIENKAIASLEEADKTLQAFRLSIENINTKFAQATEDFKKMQKDFAEIKQVTIPAVDSMMRTSENLSHASTKFGKSIDRGDYNLKKILEPLVVDIQILSNQLGDMSKQLGQNPSDMLFKSRKSRRGPGE